MTQLKGWELLRSPIPDKSDGKQVLKQLNAAVYGLSGLTDIEEWFLHERLINSGLDYEHRINATNYLGRETRTEKKKRQDGSFYEVQNNYYVYDCIGTLIIDGRSFPACGASDNKKVDAAIKGAVTSAFKNGCKNAGLSLQLWKGGALKLVEDVERQEESESPQSIQKNEPKEQSRPAQGTNQGTPRPAPGSSIVELLKAAKPLEKLAENYLNEVHPGSIPPNETEEDKKKRERTEALVWYGGQLPKPWEPGKIHAFLLGYNENKKKNLLSADDLRFETADRWLLMKLMEEHKNQCQDPRTCVGIHRNPIMAQFRFGGTILGPVEAKEALDKVASEPPA